MKVIMRITHGFLRFFIGHKNSKTRFAIRRQHEGRKIKE